MDEGVRFNVARNIARAGAVLAIIGAVAWLLLLAFHSYLSSGWAAIVFGVGLSTLLGGVVCLCDARDHCAAISKGRRGRNTQS